MSQKKGSETKLWVIIGLLSAAWTVVMITIVITVWSYNDKAVLDIAENKAITSLSKDYVYREWVSRNGGVYVPATEKTPPNPYLSHIPERDIITPSGRKLTLINPAYMTRQVHKLGFERYGLLGHITSLNPINRVNAPDPWEREALSRFEEKIEPISSLEKIDGQRFLRYIKPLVTEQSCLRCHAGQGYKLGQVRGGISISVATSPIEAAAAKKMAFIFKGFIGIWCLGIAGIGLAGWNILKQVRERASISEESKKNEARFRDVALSAGECIWEVDSEGRYTYSSPAVKEILGYEPEEMLGKYFYDSFIPEAKEEYKKGAFEVFASKESFTGFQNKNVHKDGHAVILETSGVPVLDDEGELLGYRGSDRDITERIQAEEALKESEDRFRGAFESAAHGMALVSTAGEFLKVNQSLCNIIGYSEQELLATDFQTITHPEDLDADLEHVQELLKGQKQSYQMEKRYVHKDGRYVWILLSVSLVRDSRGEPVHFISQIQDIDKRKQAEQLLKFTQFAVDHASDEAYWIDCTGRFVYANNAACEALGYSRQELLNMTVADVDPDFPPNAWPEHWRELKNQGTMRLDSRHKRKDGTVFPVEITANFVSYDGIEYNCAFARDITERKNTEKAMVQAKEHAEAANISKSQFLANMSHEIRTPMNSIVGFTDLLFEEELTEDQFDYLNMIKDNSMLLLQLISDILDFSKIDAGKLDIEIIDCPLETILSKVKSITSFRAEEKGLVYKINVCPDMPSSIVTDPTRLTQCLVNLMNNAIKFTEQGHVYLNVSLEQRDAKSYIRFDVEDTGVGIPPDKLEYVFEAFEQADKSTTRQYGGTGLGLTITKKMVELMDGEVTVSSEVDRGTVFSFILPYQHIPQSDTVFSGNSSTALD